MRIYSCKVCGNEFAISFKKEIQLSRERVAMDHTPRGTTHHRYICEDCYRNNWKFTEHGVLMNETPVKKRKKVQSNEVNFSEFYQKYEIIEQRGEIYVIQERQSQKEN